MEKPTRRRFHVSSGPIPFVEEEGALFSEALSCRLTSSTVLVLQM